MKAVAALGLGTYVLILHLPKAERIQVGHLGTFALSSGYYAYVGSVARATCFILGGCLL